MTLSTKGLSKGCSETRGQWGAGGAGCLAWDATLPGITWGNCEHQREAEPPLPSQGDLKQMPDMVCSANNWTLLQQVGAGMEVWRSERSLSCFLILLLPLNLLSLSSYQLEIHLG